MFLVEYLAPIVAVACIGGLAVGSVYALFVECWTEHREDR